MDALREQAQGIQTQKTGEALRIKLISQVPQVLLEMMKDKENFRATVMDVSQGKVRLFLDNGYEIVAENNMNIALQKEDQLELSIQDYNPLTFRVNKLQSNLKHQILLESLLEGKNPILYPSQDLRESIFLSGILYEKKLFDFLTGKLKLEDLLSDTKAQILKNIAQWTSIEGMDNTQILSHLKQILSNLQKMNKDIGILLESLDTLTLKKLSHEEYVKIVKYLKDEPILKYLELGQEDKVFQELLRVIDKNENLPFRERFIKALFDLKLLSNNVTDHELKRLIDNLIQNQEGIHNIRLYAKEILDKPLMINLSTFQDLVLKFEYIVVAQYALLKNGQLFLPLNYENAKGGIIFDIKEEYKVLIHLNYLDYYISAFITTPKTEKISSIRVKIWTDSEPIADLLRTNEKLFRELIAQEGISISGFYVNVVGKKEHIEELVEFIGKEGFHIAV